MTHCALVKEIYAHKAAEKILEGDGELAEFYDTFAQLLAMYEQDLLYEERGEVIVPA